MSLYRVFYTLYHSCSELKPQRDGSIKRTYKRKKVAEDIVAESELDAIDTINTLPIQQGDDYRRAWGACLASDHVQKAKLEWLWRAEEVSLFPEEELKKCAR